MYDIVYFSKTSENTKRFVEKLASPAIRIPLEWEGDEPFTVSKPYVLIVPTYGGNKEDKQIPEQVVDFLNLKVNRGLLRGVIGTGNTNFGETYCRAAELISAKVGVPLLYRVELLGTQDDVEQVTERLDILWTITATMN
jgi:protein involved in ribonucleotide reduction